MGTSVTVSFEEMGGDLLTVLHLGVHPLLGAHHPVMVEGEDLRVRQVQLGPRGLLELQDLQDLRVAELDRRGLPELQDQQGLPVQQGLQVPLDPRGLLELRDQQVPWVAFFST